jgi:hypothetical protein
MGICITGSLVEVSVNQNSSYASSQSTCAVTLPRMVALPFSDVQDERSYFLLREGQGQALPQSLYFRPFVDDPPVSGRLFCQTPPRT